MREKLEVRANAILKYDKVLHTEVKNEYELKIRLDRTALYFNSSKIKRGLIR